MNSMLGLNAHWLLWRSGAALLSVLRVIYPRIQVVEIAEVISGHDADSSHGLGICGSREA